VTKYSYPCEIWNIQGETKDCSSVMHWEFSSGSTVKNSADSQSWRGRGESLKTPKSSKERIKEEQAATSIRKVSEFYIVLLLNDLNNTYLCMHVRKQVWQRITIKDRLRIEHVSTKQRINSHKSWDTVNWKDSLSSEK
jgi:hypothetical protein